MGRKEKVQLDSRYKLAMDDFNDTSETFRAVNEEFDKFLSNLRLRVQKIHSLDNQESDNSNNNGTNIEILQALRLRLGSTMANAAVKLIKGPNNWNGFVRDSYQEKSEELQSQTGLAATFFLV
jgi:hypothetical protein